MTKRHAKEWDSSIGLDTPEDIAGYLDAALEDGEPRIVAIALGNIAKSKGMADIARETGLSRESLYRALGENGNPRLETLLKVVKAVGIRFSARPAA
ncbi:hypothetical protein GALL_229080 [mine drainage metagenome]|uniref:Addiction module antidote protein n=1 Tax=mine drainage metagenome TaxID=410659 RepID=A0A1J5RSZ9_9ZZZZ